MKSRSGAALAASLLAMAAGPAMSQGAGTPSRGELLYATHCVACHNSQIHWRDARLATDWPSLVAQVRRWQDRALLQWSDEDVQAVAAHLNERIYRYPQPGRVLGWWQPAR